MRLIENSNRFLILCGGVLVWCVVAGHSAAGLTLQNPYVGNPYVDVITNRNLFQLQTPKPLDTPPPPPPPPLREIKLSGITTLPSATRAILRVMGVGKPPEAAKEISLFLSPGDAAENGVQVLEIDVTHGLVKISNDGTLQTLDIAKNAPKAAAAPGPTTVSPGQPPRAGNVMTPPAAGAPPMPTNDEQTWTMALQRERDLARVSAGQMRAQDMPPYPPNEVSAEADREAMQGSP